MSFRSPVHRSRATRPVRPWHCRVLALVLGGLFLVAFDCGALLHGPDHAHGTPVAYAGAGVPEQRDGVAGTSGVPEQRDGRAWTSGVAGADDPPRTETCPLLGHEDEGDGRNRTQPLPADPGGLPAPAAGGALLMLAGTLRPQGHRRARSVRSRLTLACRWRL